MFDDDLGDDFLTSWKPTKMAVDRVELDLHEVKGPKATHREKTFASKMKMDFDFDCGFNKLSSFDIDLSFDTPPPSAKKVKNTNLPKQMKPADEDDEHPFELKGFDTVDLHDMSQTENGNLHKSGPNGRLTKTCESSVSPNPETGNMVDDHDKSEMLATGQKEDTREVSSNEKTGPTPVASQVRREDRAEPHSPLFQPDLILGQDSSPDAVGFLDHDRSTHPDFQVDTTSPGFNVPPESITASEGKAEDSCILRSHSGLEAELGTRPGGERSQSSELSEIIHDRSKTKASHGGLVSQRVTHHVHSKHQKPDLEIMLTGPGLATIVKDKVKEPYLSLDPQRLQTLQFDPLCTSSQDTAADDSLPEKCSQPESRCEPTNSESPDHPSSKSAENINLGKIDTSNPDGRTLPDSGAALTDVTVREEATGLLLPLDQVLESKTTELPNPLGGAHIDTGHRGEVQIETTTTTKLHVGTAVFKRILSDECDPLPAIRGPAVTPLLLEDCKETLEAGEQEPGNASVLNERSQAAHSALDLATPGGRGSDGSLCYAPTVSSNAGEKLRAPDCFEGRESAAREVTTPVQLTLKTAPTSGNNSVKFQKENQGIVERKAVRLNVSKRPACALLEIKNRVQIDTLKASVVYSEERKDEGGHDTHSRAKRDRRQSADHEDAGLPTIPAPMAGKEQRFQVSGVNVVRAENQSSARVLTTSKFFTTNGLRSPDRKIGNQVQISKLALERSSKFMSSTKRQLEKPEQVEPRTPAKNTTSTLDVAKDSTKDDGLHTISSSRKSRDMKVHIGAETDTAVKRLKLQSNAPTSRGIHISLLEQPKDEARKFEAGKSTTWKQMSPERIEDRAPLGSRIQRENMDISSEIQSKDLSFHSPADLSLEDNVNTVERSNQYTNKLDAMLTNLKNLNDVAKDLLVRALVTDNKLLMLNSPMAEDKIS